MPRFVLAVFLLAGVGLALSACGGDSSPSGGQNSGTTASAPTSTTSMNVPAADASGGDAGLVFPAKPLTTFESASKALNLTVSTTPVQPPNVGVYCEGKLIVTDANGNPVEGLTITVTPYMPVMRHGSPVPTSVEEQGNGVYIVHDLALSMPGKWEFILKIKGPMTDSATSPTFEAIVVAQ